MTDASPLWSVHDLSTDRLNIPDQSQTEGTPVISMIGTRAMLFEAPGAFTMAEQQKIWALMEHARNRADIEELVPGVTNLMLVFSHPPEQPDHVAAWLRQAWQTLPPHQIPGRLFEIGVCYGGAMGSDLAAVAAHAGLSPRAVIDLHQAGAYTVCAVASAPGFAYLHGLDPRIATPRKSVPSMNMPAGTVTIGGMQAGISSLSGPNGWNSIGFTEICLFDPRRESPSLFAIGDRIRFYQKSIEL